MYKPNPREVTEILEVPLRHLQSLRADELNYHFGGHLIFGATARILTELLNVLARRSIP